MKVKFKQSENYTATVTFNQFNATYKFSSLILYLSCIMKKEL